MNFAISATTRIYQYSMRDPLFVGVGLTYIGSVELVAQVVLMTFAWWNMYLSLRHVKAAVSDVCTLALHEDSETDTPRFLLRARCVVCQLDIHIEQFTHLILARHRTCDQ